MQPIHELLNRIRWDPSFAQARFALAYVDHIAHRDIVVPLASVTFDPATPGSFSVIDADGVARQIPLHRIRKVYRDEVLIWQRPKPGGATAATI